MKHGQEKSDLFIIALKPTNKPGRLGTELVGPRERTEGNMGEQHTYRTLCRIKRVPEARLCTRSCSWDSSLTTRGGSPVRNVVFQLMWCCARKLRAIKGAGTT
jgi:hypothetical protein